MANLKEMFVPLDRKPLRKGLTSAIVLALSIASTSCWVRVVETPEYAPTKDSLSFEPTKEYAIDPDWVKNNCTDRKLTTQIHFPMDRIAPEESLWSRIPTPLRIHAWTAREAKFRLVDLGGVPSSST